MATFYPPVRQVSNTSLRLAHQDGLPFAEHLPEQQIHQAVRDAGGSFRERVFTPAITLWTFLSQVFDPDHSCRQAVARLLAFRVAKGLAPCSPETGATARRGSVSPRRRSPN